MDHTEVKMLCKYDKCMGEKYTEIRTVLILRWYIFFPQNNIHVTCLLKFPEESKLHK